MCAGQLVGPMVVLTGTDDPAGLGVAKEWVRVRVRMTRKRTQCGLRSSLVGRWVAGGLWIAGALFARSPGRRGGGARELVGVGVWIGGRLGRAEGRGGGPHSGFGGAEALEVRCFMEEWGRGGGLYRALVTRVGWSTAERRRV